MRDFDVMSITHQTHDLDYLLPRMPDSVVGLLSPQIDAARDNLDPPRQMCTRRQMHRFLACLPAYKRDHRVLGINQPCAFYQ